MKMRKKGEDEAIIILKSIGVEVDKDYYDDNSVESMPDLKTKEGQKIEVTHTYHNNGYFSYGSQHIQRLIKNPAEEMERSVELDKKCGEALERLHRKGYETGEDGIITSDGMKKYKADCKLVKSHLGYDPTAFSLRDKFSEFKCDNPSFWFTTGNILREIRDDKGKKYSNGDTELFVFATVDEFNNMLKLIPEYNWNGSAVAFLNTILKSPFPIVYVCEWEFETQTYNTTNPRMVKYYMDGEALGVKYYNIKITN